MRKNNLIKFKSGQTIFNKDDSGEHAYLINSGVVEVRNGDIAIAILGEGEIIGEMAIIDGSTRSATAIALDNCELIEISKAQLNERIDDADPVVKFLISMLMTRLRESLSSDEVSDHTKPNFITTGKVVSLDNFKSNKDVVEKIKLETELRDAIVENELRVHYQPILDFRTGNISGFEALMRWQSPDRGFVRPDVFIGVAEETSLIIPMGHWIIKQSIKDFARLKTALINEGKYKKPMFMSINVAAKQFADKDLFKVLNFCVEKYRVDPREIKLEITERVLLAGDFVFKWIDMARAKGYSVALDDFGTGYSSLNYLANLSVNNLKIDKSFVDKIIENEKSRSIVKSIIDMSKNLNISVIAEGVEEQKEWDLLRSFGCDYMQGYLYSKPLAYNDLIALLSRSAGHKKKAA